MRLTCLFFVIAGLFLAGCKKDEEAPAFDLGYDYFPNEERQYIIYEVDSTSYSIEEVTYSFQIKEILAYEFIDGEGQAAMAVERYKRLNNNEDWQLTDVWVQKRTPTTAERIEENVRYIRLAFPAELDKTWNGNAYNTIGEWDYTITEIDKPRDLGFLEFTKTLKVQQRNNVNLVDQEIAFEIYAKNVGLVYKQLTDLNYQSGQITGVDMTMRAIAYGYEF